MIDSVVKTPELTPAQAKYLKYEVSYANGESINTKQTIKSGTSTPIKVRIEYRNDLSASDLPSSTTNLSLKLTLVYVQSDGSGSSVKDNGVYKVATANGSLDAIGTIVTIGDQQFYTIGTEGDNVKLLSMYNLYVGNSVDSDWNVTPLASPTGIQDKTAKGYDGIFPLIGTTAFSSDSQKGTSYSDYSGSIVEGYVNNYKTILEADYGVDVVEARLISSLELIGLGCSEDDYDHSCSTAPSWVYATSYWSGSAYSSYDVWFVRSDGYVGYDNFFRDNVIGCRPVITISRSLI